MKSYRISLAIGTVLLLASTNANATLVSLGAGSFTPAATVITFDEFPLNTVNPTYTFGSQTINFDGYFVGGLGTPTDPLALDPASPDTFITTDGANPTSPVLSGTPLFNGSIAMLFSENVAAVGLDGGYFDAIGGTTIEAYGRDGSLLGSVTNSALGIEFFGLGDSTGNAVIAGIQFYITGNEPAGYAIDNVTFAYDLDGYNPGEVPEPATMLLFGSGIAGLVGSRLRKRK